MALESGLEVYLGKEKTTLARVTFYAEERGLCVYLHESQL